MNLKSLKEKLPGLMLTLMIASVGGWALWQFGPRPGSVVNAPPPVANKNQSGEAQPTGILPFAPSVLASNRTAPASSGSDPRSVAEYLQVAEARYQQRGYRKVAYNAQQPTKPPVIPRGAAKLYWLAQSDGFHLIGAFGVDANLQSSAPAARAETVVTLVKTAESGGVQWETYQFAGGQTVGQPPSLPAVTEADLSGIDPPGIPKPASLHRVLSFNAPGEGQGSLIAVYTGNDPPDVLGNWYRQQMITAGWQFNAPESASAQQAADGTLCFSSGDQLCLVWIGKDEECNCTSVIISTKHLTN